MHKRLLDIDYTVEYGYNWPNVLCFAAAAAALGIVFFVFWWFIFYIHCAIKLLFTFSLCCIGLVCHCLSVHFYCLLYSSLQQLSNGHQSVTMFIIRNLALIKISKRVCCSLCRLHVFICAYFDLNVVCSVLLAQKGEHQSSGRGERIFYCFVMVNKLV